ncbi:MAG: hypothetical protein WEA77_12200 [Hyphomonas sp.]|uniref:hypothetical protein n=1 Tax=Hyphomonas sp. TaxID=87 RepID=UPI0034A09D69
MTGLQRLILFFIPGRRRAEAETKSRAWHLVCDVCGHARSIWDLGGVRWRASGNRVTRTKYAAFKAVGFHTVTRQSPS